MMRLSPPSTGIRYTMSALDSPVAGRSGSVFPILTASTGCSDVTGSPVNGDSNGPVATTWWVGDGVGSGDGTRAGAAVPRENSRKPSKTRATMAAAPSAAKPLARPSQIISSPLQGSFPPLDSMITGDLAAYRAQPPVPGPR